MSILEVNSDVVPASPYHDPIKIRSEDFESLQEIQAYNDALVKYRQEIGRLIQALSNLTNLANETEVGLAERRRALTTKYNIETMGEGQWAVDFEKKEFVRLSAGSPVIP